MTTEQKLERAESLIRLVAMELAKSCPTCGSEIEHNAAAIIADHCADLIRDETKGIFVDVQPAQQGGEKHEQANNSGGGDYRTADASVGPKANAD